MGCLKCKAELGNDLMNTAIGPVISTYKLWCVSLSRPAIVNCESLKHHEWGEHLVYNYWWTKRTITWQASPLESPTKAIHQVLADPAVLKGTVQLLELIQNGTRPLKQVPDLFTFHIFIILLSII